ncbi:FLU1-II [Rhodofomes roseus]|uniref:Glutamine synthetase n=1 Tax=Rhodofomes roseus TaxID=34475 RepID=A0ABQ8KBQ3_9APHY|nr:FLU1-II [Rhodofomes roseus]KAH9834982.1 FLU1-II [Rhodofomes roseus]
MGITSEYAVVYKPDSIPSSKQDSVRGLRLESRGIKFVRVQFVDYTNTVRFRILPITYFKRVCETLRPGVLFDLSLLGTVEGDIAESFSTEAASLYAIDFSSFRACPYAPGHATIMGWFQMKTASPTGSLTIPFCPRTLLESIVTEAKLKAGLTFLAGFETEFTLLRLQDASTQSAPVNRAGWGASSGHRSGTVEKTGLEEIVENLLDVGVEVQALHGGAAPGQYELVMGPSTPLEAADTLVHTRETFYNVASKHGLRATFAAKLHTNSRQSPDILLTIDHVTHLLRRQRRHSSAHIPAYQQGRGNLEPRTCRRNRTYAHAHGRSFLQTLVEHIPALSAINLPIAASYERARDGEPPANAYASWSSSRKDVPVRLCGDRGAHHIEVRTIDGTSNPYLVLAGVLAAGLLGVFSGAKLTFGDCLPRTLCDARRLLQEDGALREKLGEEFVSRFLSANESLERVMTQSTEGDNFAHMFERY